MTTIDKIAICGIRSYDPNGLVVIKFFKPLTIILGNNGCGKTTIIEALKYVCTGEVPPLSDRGRTFVHDPNHCGVNVVKAQVKVAFKTRDGKPVIVNSSMQLTQKPRKTEFKTIDGVVRMYDESTNEQIALSHKCADMKKVVPELMGVSRAILDNVIFCHQEDADWPLSESKKLKEKFDSIFATSRWSKALVAITAYRKILNTRSKDIKTDLKVYENNKEIALKLSTDLQETKVRMAQYKDRNKKYNLKIQELKNNKLKPLVEKREKLQTFDSKKRVIENDISHLRVSQKNAHDRMSCEYEESDDELHRFLLNHDKQILNKEKELEIVNKKYEKLKIEMNKMNQQVNELHAKRGKIEQIKSENKNKKMEVNKRMKLMKQRYNLNANNNDTNDMIKKLEIGKLNKKKELEEFQRKSFENDQILEREINNFVNNKNQLNFRISELNKKQKENNKNRTNLNNKLNKIMKQLNECPNVKNQIKIYQNKLKEFENDPTKQWEKEIIEYQKIVQLNNNKMKALNIERRELQNQSSFIAKLQFKKEEYKNLETQYNKSLGLIKNKIITILNDGTNELPKMDNLQNKFIEKNKSLRKNYEIASSKYNKLQTSQSIKENELKLLQNEKYKIEQLLSENIIQLSSENITLDGSNLELIISDAKDITSSKQSELALAKCGRTLYSKFNTLARKKNQCPVCQRHFNNNSQLNKFIKTNTNRIEKVSKSGAIEKHEIEFNKANQKLENLQTKMKPIYENALQQRENLTDLELKFEKLNIFIKKNESELEEEFTCHIESKNIYDKSSILISNVNELCRQFKLLKLKKHEYENNKQELQCLTGNNRNLNDLQNEYDELSNENNAKNELMNRLRNKINQYDRKKREIHNKLIEFQTKFSKFEKLNIEKQKIETEELNNCLIFENEIINELTQLNEKISPISNEIKKQKLLREKRRNNNNQKLAQLRNNLNKYSTDIHNLSQKCSELHESNKLISKYINLENELIISEREYKNLQSNFQQSESKKYTIQKWLDNVIIDKQDLDSNLEFRKYKKLVSEKKEELMKLKLEMNKIYANSDSILEEIDELKMNIGLEQSNLDQNVGGMNSEKRKALSLMDELRTDRYANISERYRQQLIKYETILIASKDLDKFEKALDKSLIEFHSLKMKEINAVLKELWQQTYKGKDIDYIEIVSEIGKNTSTKKRKNYNYNVIMKQGDASLTMRGRCSAGQRVLASLLIRLALAETFCLNCGVLALDEPTTNLDSKNIEALAYALNQIITRRKRHENFQLILITHDEQFVEKLGQREHTDGYYRVFKNDFQHSKAKLYKFDGSADHNNNQDQNNQNQNRNRNRNRNRK